MTPEYEARVSEQAKRYRARGTQADTFCECLESFVLLRKEDQENQFSCVSSLSKLLFQDDTAAGLRFFWWRWVITLELVVLHS